MQLGLIITAVIDVECSIIRPWRMLVANRLTLFYTRQHLWMDSKTRNAHIYSIDKLSMFLAWLVPLVWAALMDHIIFLLQLQSPPVFPDLGFKTLKQRNHFRIRCPYFDQLHIKTEKTDGASVGMLELKEYFLVNYQRWAQCYSNTTLNFKLLTTIIHKATHTERPREYK